MSTSLDDAAANDLLRFSGSVARELSAALNRVNDVHAFTHGAKNSVVAVEPRGGHGREEELGPTGVAAGVGHGEHTGLVVLEGEGRGLAGDLPAWTAGTGSTGHWVLGVGAAALNHEVLNDAMEVESVVVPRIHQLDEVGDGVGSTAVKEVDGDVACAGFHENLHATTTERHLKRICLVCTNAQVDNSHAQKCTMSDLIDIPFATMDGETTTLRDLGGSRWLVVNVASACGATPQYAGLQSLHEAHDDLTVVGFPCNQFGAQEPGTHAEICDFTASKYNVSFPLMAKADVNGPDRQALYEALCQHADAGGHAGDIRWNFEKFIIEKDGAVKRFSSGVKPDALGL